MATPRPRRRRSAETSRGDAEAATWIFRGHEARRRRGRDVDGSAETIRGDTGRDVDGSVETIRGDTGRDVDGSVESPRRPGRAQVRPRLRGGPGENAQRGRRISRLAEVSSDRHAGGLRQRRRGRIFGPRRPQSAAEEPHLLLRPREPRDDLRGRARRDRDGPRRSGIQLDDAPRGRGVRARRQLGEPGPRERLFPRRGLPRRQRKSARASLGPPRRRLPPAERVGPRDVVRKRGRAARKLAAAKPGRLRRGADGRARGRRGIAGRGGAAATPRPKRWGDRHCRRGAAATPRPKHSSDERRKNVARPTEDRVG